MSRERRLGAEARRRRAVADVRAAHAEILGFGPGLWDGEPRRLLDFAEAALESLRAATPGPRRLRHRSLAQAVAVRSVFLTWDVPDGFLPSRGPCRRMTHPSSADGQARATSWAAGFIRYLEEEPPGVLAHVYARHEFLGDLDPYEWARLLRILVRRNDLRLP